MVACYCSKDDEFCWINVPFNAINAFDEWLVFSLAFNEEQPHNINAFKYFQSLLAPQCAWTFHFDAISNPSLPENIEVLSASCFLLSLVLQWYQICFSLFLNCCSNLFTTESNYLHIICRIDKMKLCMNLEHFLVLLCLSNHCHLQNNNRKISILKLPTEPIHLKVLFLMSSCLLPFTFLSHASYLLRYDFLEAKSSQKCLVEGFLFFACLSQANFSLFLPGYKVHLHLLPLGSSGSFVLFSNAQS